MATLCAFGLLIYTVFPLIAANLGLLASDEHSRREVPELPEDPKKLSDDEMIQAFQRYPFQRPLDPLFTRKQWQVAGATFQDSFVYSAYYDDREFLDPPKGVGRPTEGSALPDGSSGAMIRLLVVADQVSAELTERLFCLLWYRHKEAHDVTKIETIRVGSGNVTTTNEDIDLMEYVPQMKSAILSCPVPTGASIPEYVTIIGEDAVVPSNIVPVRIPEKPPNRKQVGVCVGPYTGHYDVYRLIEYTELYHRFGASQIFAYNRSLGLDTLAVFRHYTSSDFVQVRDIPDYIEHPQVELSEVLLNTAMNDCMFSNMFRFQYLVLIEPGALVVPKEDYALEDMMLNLNILHDKDRHSPTSYLMSNGYFALDFSAAVDEPSFLVSPRYIVRMNHSEYRDPVMSIVNPRQCLYVAGYECHEPRPKYRAPGWQVEVAEKTGMTYYYRHCQQDEDRKVVTGCNESLQTYHVDDSLLQFVEDVTIKVVDILWRLGLVDLTNYDEGPIQQELQMDESVNGSGRSWGYAEPLVEGGSPTEGMDGEGDQDRILAANGSAQQDWASQDIENDYVYDEADLELRRQAEQQANQVSNGAQSNRTEMAAATQSNSTNSSPQTRDRADRNPDYHGKNISDKSDPVGIEQQNTTHPEEAKVGHGHRKMNLGAYLIKSVHSTSGSSGRSLQDGGKGQNLTDSPHLRQYVKGVHSESSKQKLQNYEKSLDKKSNNTRSKVGDEKRQVDKKTEEGSLDFDDQYGESVEAHDSVTLDTGA